MAKINVNRDEFSEYHNDAWNDLSDYYHDRYNDTFNCLDMSNDWADIFIKLGLNVSIMLGHNEEPPHHCWVKVYFPNGNSYEFESTLAIFKPVSDNGYVSIKEI